MQNNMERKKGRHKFFQNDKFSFWVISLAENTIVNKNIRLEYTNISTTLTSEWENANLAVLINLKPCGVINASLVNQFLTFVLPRNVRYLLAFWHCQVPQDVHKHINYTNSCRDTYHAIFYSNRILFLRGFQL